MPLSAVESEKAILGLLLTKPDLLDRAEEIRSSIEFAGHRLLLDRLEQLWQKHKTVDLILLHDSLNEEEIKSIGGAGYLASLVVNLPKEPSFDALLDAIKSAAKRRSYKEMAERLMAALAAGDDDNQLDAIRLSAEPSAPATVSTGIKEAAEAAAQSIHEIRNKGVDLHFGIKHLDDSLGGIRRKKLYTIGGRTSQGKTTVCANIITDNLRENRNCKIYYNGFENVDEMPIRLAAMHDNVRLDWFIKPHLTTEEEYSRTLLALGELQQYNERLLISIGDSVSQMRQVCKANKPDIVFVDYIQRLAHKYNLGGSDRLSHAIGKAVSDLQDIAIDYNCAMFCCSQFRRTQAEFKGKEPSIEDLKESGDIENESDNILLLWWPWRETLDDSRYIQNQYRILVRKNKLGPCGDTYGKINLETLKISDW